MKEIVVTAKDYIAECVRINQENAALRALVGELVEALDEVKEYANEYNSNVSGHLVAYTKAEALVAKAKEVLG